MAKAQERARAGGTAGAAGDVWTDQEGVAAAATLDAALPKLDGLKERMGAIADLISGRIAFSTSLGIEDQAVLHGIIKSGRSFDVFTLDTGRHFPETLETLDAIEMVYDFKVRVVFPEASDVELLVARDGIMGFRHSVEARKACCHVRKVLPLNKALAGAAGWVTGLRRDQSNERAHVPFAAWDGEHKLVKLNPIADWSLEKLEAYIAEHGVPINPLHARGFPSIGCQPCTRAIRPGEDIRAGRWWWENQDGKECGLHSSPNRKEAHA